jgi:hypothetical protein
MRRVIVALCGVAAAFAALAVWLDLERGSPAPGWGIIAVFGGILAAGFPVLFRCCKRHRWEAWRWTAHGTAAGVLSTLPFIGGPFGFGFLLLIYALAGTLFGLLFWVTAIWRNEDLTCPKSFCLPCGTAYKFARNALRRRDLAQSK